MLHVSNVVEGAPFHVVPVVGGGAMSRTALHVPEVDKCRKAERVRLARGLDRQRDMWNVPRAMDLVARERRRPAPNAVDQVAYGNDYNATSSARNC